MTKKYLSYVSSTIVDELHSKIDDNVTIYQSGDFNAASAEAGWSIETKDVRYDPLFGSELDPSNSPASEVANSLLVFNALEGMTPALAREERIWVRLCHVDCLEYSRGRWIGASAPARDVRNHFFANRLDQTRDDNAIGRLWWNGFLAGIIDPDDPKSVLIQLLKRANIRMQFVDRANASFRLPLARGIVRLLQNEPWLDSHDKAFEHFMLAMDRNAGGLLFEASSNEEMDEFLIASMPLARKMHDERVITK